MVHFTSVPEGVLVKVIASLRKDVERVFGILKIRCRAIKNRSNIHSPETLDNVMFCACIMHNALLLYDSVWSKLGETYNPFSDNVCPLDRFSLQPCDSNEDYVNSLKDRYLAVDDDAIEHDLLDTLKQKVRNKENVKDSLYVGFDGRSARRDSDPECEDGEVEIAAGYYTLRSHLANHCVVQLKKAQSAKASRSGHVL